MSIVIVMKFFQYAGNILLLILLLGACAKAPSQFYNSFPTGISKTDETLFSRAIAHQQKGQIEPAIALWEKFLEKYPNSYEARNNLGFLYYANDQINKAIVQFDQGLSLESGSVKIKDNLLRSLKVRVAIFAENKEYDEAITDLNRIAQLSPTKEKEKIERQIESFEDKIFHQVKKSNLIGEYQGFLKKYPNSPQNSDEARLWLQKLQKTQEIKQEDQVGIQEFAQPEGRTNFGNYFSDENEENLEIIEESFVPGSQSNAKAHSAPIEQTVLSQSLKIVEVIKSRVINVHSEPKIKSDNIIHKLQAGTQVIYSDENEGWYQVEFPNGKKGWVIKKYTRLLE